MIEKQGGVQYPVLPLRDIVVFPHMVVPLFVGREKSVRALEDVMKDDKQILLVTQKNAAQMVRKTRIAIERPLMAFFRRGNSGARSTATSPERAREVWTTVVMRLSLRWYGAARR